MTHDERAHQRHRLLRRAGEDARKQVVRHAERFAFDDQRLELGIGDGLFRQRRDVGHSAASALPSEIGAAP